MDHHLYIMIITFYSHKLKIHMLIVCVSVCRSLALGSLWWRKWDCGSRFDLLLAYMMLQWGSLFSSLLLYLHGSHLLPHSKQGLCSTKHSVGAWKSRLSLLETTQILAFKFTHKSSVYRSFFFVYHDPLLLFILPSFSLMYFLVGEC